MLIIPIGYDTEVTIRLPIITVLIIVINCVVGFIIFPKMEAEEEAFYERVQTLVMKYQEEAYYYYEYGEDIPDDFFSEDILMQKKEYEQGLQEVTQKYDELDKLQQRRQQALQDLKKRRDRDLQSVTDENQRQNLKAYYQQEMERINQSYTKRRQDTYQDISETQQENYQIRPDHEAMMTEVVKKLEERLMKELEEEQKQLSLYQWGFVPTNLTVRGVIGHMFLHADWLHLFFNMLYLFITGVLIEHIWGRGAFLAFYLVAGLFGAAGFYLENMGNFIIMIGASGAVAGLMGAFLITHPTLPIKFFVWLLFPFRVGIRAYIVLPIWFILEVLFMRYTESNTAHSAHIGGFVFGVVTALILKQTSWAEDIKSKYKFDLSDPHEDTLQAAQAALRAGNIPQSLGLVKGVLTENPEHRLALALLGDCHLAQNQPDQAASYFRQSILEAVKRRDYKIVMDGYLRLRQTGVAADFDVPTLFVIAKALENGNYLEQTGQIYDQLWDHHRLQFNFKQLLSYADYMIYQRQDRAKALAILETIEHHPDFVADFRESVEDLQAKANELAPEAESETTATPAGSPLEFTAAPSGETESLSIGKTSQPLNDYREPGNKPLPDPDYGNIVLDDYEPAPSSSQDDPADFGAIDWPVAEPVVPVCHVEDALLVKLTADHLTLFIEGRKSDFQWPAIFGVALAKLNDKSVLDVIVRENDAKFQVYRLQEGQQKIPPTAKLDAAQFLTQTAKIAYKNGVRWIFQQNDKPVILRFNTADELTKKVIEMIETSTPA